METSAPGLRSLLRDSRLSTLATSRFPAWLWSQDGRRLLWANPVGAAMFGAPSSAAVIGRNFDADEPAAAAIARIAPTLVKGASPRLERLHGLGAGTGRALTCACSLIALSGHSSAILVAAAEPAGPDLPLAERIRRLLAGSEGPIAGFTGDGRVLHAQGAASSRGHPLRFIWQIDDQGRFTLGSDEFVALTGPHTAAAIGRTWPELETELHLDPEGKVAGAIATRDTWSGLMVSWPVDDSPVRLAVELSGRPVFDRDRTFRGYRGFGVCREEAHVVASAEHRKTRPCGNGMPAETSAAGILPEPALDAGGLPSLSDPSAQSLTPALSQIERNAFRELSRKLAQRLTSAGIESRDEDPAGWASEGGPAVGGPLAGSTMAERTEQARIERLQAELTGLRSTLDAVTDGIVAFDHGGLILSANRSAQVLFGYPHLPGRAFTDLFAAESAEEAEHCLDALVRDGIAGPVNGGCEMIGRRRQGDLIPLLVTIGRIGEDVDRFYAVFRDIARWKKMQDELKEARHHVELASVAKSDLLAKISHEVRTPLYSIIGFSEVMMEEQYGPIGNERLREYLKDIHASGDQLMSLVNDLLDLAKIEAGELELAFSDVALDDLTRQCVTMMRTQASHRRVIIRTSLWSSPPRVLADAQSLRKIVLGLLSNAIKFTDAGGQVIVSTAHTEAGEVVMHVRNTGVGMRGGDIVTAFEPLRQLAISARRDAVGGGLSLRLTKALTEANHASFKLTSVAKEGTLVEIAFPASRVLPG